MRLLLGINSAALCLTFLMQSSHAQARMFSLGGSFGVGYLPMSNWRDWEDSGYEADPVGLYGEVYARVQLRERHGLSLSVERITKSASYDAPQPDPFKFEWNFATVPINLTYEYSLRGWSTGTTPFFGLGLGAYHSEVRNTFSDVYYSPSDEESDGWGFGIHGYIGQRVVVTQLLAISGKLRCRWADGWYFTDATGFLEFTGVDVTLGAEWLF